MSTPHGTTRIEERCTPRLARSETSAEFVATTAVALRPMAGSSLIRAADAPSAVTAPDWSAAARRSATPRELNSCTSGMPRSRAAASAGQAAGPAQRVHDIRAVALPEAAQRAAEGGHPLEQVCVPGLGGGLGDRAGVYVLDPDSGVQLSLVGQVGQVLLGVDGHLVTLSGQLAGELAEPVVVTVRA